MRRGRAPCLSSAQQRHLHPPLKFSLAAATYLCFFALNSGEDNLFVSGAAPASWSAVQFCCAAARTVSLSNLRFIVGDFKLTPILSKGATTKLSSRCIVALASLSAKPDSWRTVRTTLASFFSSGAFQRPSALLYSGENDFFQFLHLCIGELKRTFVRAASTRPKDFFNSASANSSAGPLRMTMARTTSLLQELSVN